MWKNDISGQENQEKERRPYEYFRLVARLTNKSNNKICILVALVSPLLDPALTPPPFSCHTPCLRYSFAFPPPRFSASLLSLSPSLSAESWTNSDHEFSNPFHQSMVERGWIDTREAWRVSDGAAKKSQKPSKM